MMTGLQVGVLFLAEVPYFLPEQITIFSTSKIIELLDSLTDMSSLVSLPVILFLIAWRREMLKQ